MIAHAARDTHTECWQTSDYPCTSFIGINEAGGVPIEKTVEVRPTGKKKGGWAGSSETGDGGVTDSSDPSGGCTVTQEDRHMRTRNTLTRDRGESAP